LAIFPNKPPTSSDVAGQPPPAEPKDLMPSIMKDLILIDSRLSDTIKKAERLKSILNG